MEREYPTKEELCRLFEYKDGNLICKQKTNNKSRIKIGDVIGTIGSDGYYKTKINGVFYFVHRLIFLMHYGFVPKIIDHINGIRSDNRIQNLREATQRQNSYNRKLRINNKSGVKNVCWDPNANLWKVQISIDGKQTNCGFFASLEDARIRATALRKKHHRDFANHG